MVLDKMKDILVEQLECNPEDITMESLLVDFVNMAKKILVTGAGGYIGRDECRRYVQG